MTTSGCDIMITWEPSTSVLISAPLVVLEESGHLPHVEEPEAFFEAVEGWVERNYGALFTEPSRRIIFRSPSLRRSPGS